MVSWKFAQDLTELQKREQANDSTQDVNFLFVPCVKDVRNKSRKARHDNSPVPVARRAQETLGPEKKSSTF